MENISIKDPLYGNSTDWKDIATRRSFILRLVFIFIFCSLLYSYCSHTLTHQLQSPVIRYPYVDLSYWIFHLAGIPELVTGNHTLALLLDLCLFVFCLLAVLFPAGRTYPAFFFIAYAVYFLIFNTYGTHHTHSKTGILLMPIPFLFKKGSFAYVWKGMRYFLLFAYSAAFFWKLFRLSWLHENQGLLIVKKNLTAYLYYHPDTLAAHFYQRLLQHPAVVNTAYIAGFIAEGCFIAGFFTTRFDKWLFGLSILLPLGFYVIADAFFLEMLIFSLTLINYSGRNYSSGHPKVI